MFYRENTRWLKIASNLFLTVEKSYLDEIIGGSMLLG